MRRGRCIALAGIPDALAKHVLPPWDETGTSGHHSAPRPADEVALEHFLVAKPTKMDAVNGKPTVVDPTLMVTDGPTVPPTPSTGPPLRGGGREVKVTTEAERPAKFMPTSYTAAVKMTPPELWRGVATLGQWRKEEQNCGYRKGTP